jgi:hypothetical protein
MHHLRSKDYLAPIDMPDALMPEADTQYRDEAAESPDYLIGKPSLTWGAGTGAYDNMVGLPPLHLIKCEPVIPPDQKLRSHLPKILDKIICE